MQNFKTNSQTNYSVIIRLKMISKYTLSVQFQLFYPQRDKNATKNGTFWRKREVKKDSENRTGKCELQTDWLPAALEYQSKKYELMKTENSEYFNWLYMTASQWSKM